MCVHMVQHVNVHCTNVAVSFIQTLEMWCTCNTENKHYWTHHTHYIVHIRHAVFTLSCQCASDQQLWTLKGVSLIPLWTKCITVLSWQQAIAKELSGCSQEKMWKWLTLHNAHWMVCFLFRNADEHDEFHQSKSTAASYTPKIPSSHKWRFAFLGCPWAPGAPYLYLHMKFFLLHTFIFIYFLEQGLIYPS